jgi:hypothetical protein
MSSIAIQILFTRKRKISRNINNSVEHVQAVKQNKTTKLYLNTCYAILILDNRQVLLCMELSSVHNNTVFYHIKALIQFLKVLKVIVTVSLIH